MKKRLLAVITLPTLLAAAIPATVYAKTSEPMLQQGAMGTAVVTLQNDLNSLGYPVGQADGDFGAITAQEVRAFQTAKHLQVDGVVGPGTWSAIDRAVQSATPAPITLGNGAIEKLERKYVYYNGKLLTSPYGFTYQSTDYMPIWYLMNTMDKLGFSHTWSNGVWNIIVPSSYGSGVDYSKISYGKGSTSIAINGTIVARVEGIVHTDPASGRPTMFMPTWYVMQALKRIGIRTTWDGVTWKMLPTPSTPTSTPQPSGHGSGGDTGSGGKTGGNTGSGGNTGGNKGSSGQTSSNPSFSNVDLRFPAPADINAESIDKYLAANDSPMTGLGASVMAAQNTYGVDANYLVSHAILESYWGQSSIALAKNNLYGYGAYDSNPGDDAGMFPSDDYAIRFEAWEVRNNYLDPGGSQYVKPTLNGMNVHYATDKQWASSIGGLMNQFAQSIGSSVADYQQYPSNQNVPAPKSTEEPVFYLNGAMGTTVGDPYYNNSVPYYSDMATGMSNMFFGPLKSGSAGESVAEVQQFLNQQLGAGLTVDGQFGPATQSAVNKFETQIMKMSSPDGVWSEAMWQTYIGQLPNTPTIPAGTSVQIDQIKQGMANGLVVPWYHVVGKGWVDSQFVRFTNVYRVRVANQTGTATSIPLYSASNPSQQILTLHNGDFVVANSATPNGQMYTVNVDAQTAAQCGGRAPGTPITGVISAQVAQLVPQP